MNVETLNQLNNTLQCQLIKNNHISFYLYCTFTNFNETMSAAPVQSLNVGLEENWHSPWKEFSADLNKVEER